MKTSIDWLAFRTKTDAFDVVEAIAPIFGTAHDLITFLPGLRGKDGWTHAGEIRLAGDIALGRIDYGGHSQRGWVRVNLTGEGCAWVQRWDLAQELPSALLEAEIKRLDIALTTYDGEVSDSMILDAYHAGKFTAGGRPPELRSITSSDPRAGITRYVGKRENHKFLRCYEKGFEMLKDVPHLRNSVTHVNGHQVDKIYRVELELKAVDKVIPWGTLMGRDEVFAGSYPFCAELMPGVPHWRMKTMPDLKPILSLDRALNNVRQAYGSIIRTAIEAHGGDPLKVMERIIGDTPSQALVDAGVLTVNHP